MVPAHLSLILCFYFPRLISSSFQISSANCILLSLSLFLSFSLPVSIQRHFERKLKPAEEVKRGSCEIFNYFSFYVREPAAGKIIKGAAPSRINFCLNLPKVFLPITKYKIISTTCLGPVINAIKLFLEYILIPPPKKNRKQFALMPEPALKCTDNDNFWSKM